MSGLDPAINRLHRCVAIMLNLSTRPTTDRCCSIFALCQEVMVKTTTTAPHLINVAKLYLQPLKPRDLQRDEYQSLRNVQYTDAFKNHIDDIVMSLLAMEPTRDMTLDQHFSNLVILENKEDKD